MTNKIIAGKFDAEQAWADTDSAHLPVVHSAYYNNVVYAMDELMAAYSEHDDDIVLTQTAMDQGLLEYLSRLGVAGRYETYLEFDKGVHQGMALETYAVTPEYSSFAQNHDLSYIHPEHDVVKKVNSKFYSVNVSRKLGVNDYALLIEDYEKLKHHIEDMLGIHKRVMVKEEFGVSGKGNIFIDGSNKNRFLNNVWNQAEKGKRIRYIIEPGFEVEKDFSSQWFITKQGNIQFISMFEIKNYGSAYGGSMNMTEKTLQLLEKTGYLETIKKVGEELYRDGYFGDFCIDSMVLKDDTLIPVVEINARKSMSLTKHQFDQKFLKRGGTGTISYMFSVEAAYKSDAVFEDILKTLHHQGLGYDPYHQAGVIPLTCNTLFANRHTLKEVSRGRIYYYAAALNREDMEKLLTGVGNIRAYGGM